MSTVKELARQFVDGVNRNHQARLDELFSGGFEEAARICLNILSENINDLSNKNKTASQLSAQDRHLLLMLHEIKREAEGRLRGFWDIEGDR
jgi:hypothetical protein